MDTVPNYPLPPDDRFDTAMIEVVADYLAFRGYQPYIGEGTPDFERLRSALRWFLYGEPIAGAPAAVDPQVVQDYAARIRIRPHGDHDEAITLGIISALLTPGLQFDDPMGRIRAALAALDVVKAERRSGR